MFLFKTRGCLWTSAFYRGNCLWIVHLFLPILSIPNSFCSVRDLMRNSYWTAASSTSCDGDSLWICVDRLRSWKLVLVLVLVLDLNLPINIETTTLVNLFMWRVLFSLILKKHIEKQDQKLKFSSSRIFPCVSKSIELISNICKVWNNHAQLK